MKMELQVERLYKRWHTQKPVGVFSKKTMRTHFLTNIRCLSATRRYMPHISILRKKMLRMPIS